jgi:hypothetical protein
MFKICNDKTYYVVQTTSEDVVVEIYTKKDGRGSGISLHEMHLDLCRAIRKLQHDGYTIMKVYPAISTKIPIIILQRVTCSGFPALRPRTPAEVGSAKGCVPLSRILRKLGCEKLFL